MISNILVTSGATLEPIASLRPADDGASGRLGSLIADALAGRNGVDNVTYIYGRGATLPTNSKITPIAVGSVDELFLAVHKSYDIRQFDAVVHAMSVSDYRVGAAVSAEDAFRAAKSASDAGAFSAALHEADKRGGRGLLTSEPDLPILVLERTPNILPLFRQLSPHAVVIGFLPPSGSKNEGLIDSGYKLLLKNGCDYIFAEEDVSSDERWGYLINSGRLVFPLSGEETIAEGIVSAVFGAGNN